MLHVYKDNPNNVYKIAIIIKKLSFNIEEIKKYYIDPLVSKGIAIDDIIIIGVDYNEQNKAPVAFIKEHLDTHVYRVLKQLEVQYILITDPAYFKVMTGKRKAEPHYGYILECIKEDYVHIGISLSINFAALFYNPSLISKLTLSLDTLVEKVTSGFLLGLGTDVIHSAYYPETLTEVQQALEDLHKYPRLSCDIETFSLRLDTAGIGTIAFAWDKHNGIAFCVDIYSKLGKEIRLLLLAFFNKYQGNLLYHGGTFDIRILIYELFMQNSLDQQGLHEGLEVMYQSVEDTKLITYLATNTTAGNKLDLKSNTHEFTGNYAQEDIKDITKIPKEQLLEYNLIDCLATWYLYDKYYDCMVQDKQLDIYYNIFIPSMRVVTQIELSGMPLDIDQVAIARKTLEVIRDTNLDILNCPFIWDFEDALRAQTRDKHNAKLKKKVKPLSDWVNLEFNPGSPKQLRQLVYDKMGFDVVDTTDTGLPATGAKTLTKLRNQLISKYAITKEELK